MQVDSTAAAGTAVAAPEPEQMAAAEVAREHGADASGTGEAGGAECVASGPDGGAGGSNAEAGEATRGEAAGPPQRVFDLFLVVGLKNSQPCVFYEFEAAAEVRVLVIQKGTRVLISPWDSLMFGRVPKSAAANTIAR